MKRFTQKINESKTDELTAEKWLTNHKELSIYKIEDHDEGGYSGVNEEVLYKIMIEFAKVHVKRALEAAVNKVELIEDDVEINPNSLIIDEDSILNSYPLENIK